MSHPGVGIRAARPGPIFFIPNWNEPDFFQPDISQMCHDIFYYEKWILAKSGLSRAARNSLSSRSRKFCARSRKLHPDPGAQPDKNRAAWSRFGRPDPNADPCSNLLRLCYQIWLDGCEYRMRIRSSGWES